ncbi:alpha/beta-hydrolase [Salix suchowensis]|nr:alpha/beta-hydrolase [Salix suchowensis]
MAQAAGRMEGKPPEIGSGDKSQKVKKERVILYIHGALDYRLAPESRFPGPLHDAATGYLRLVEDLHIPPENIVIAGDSAGGGLTLALLMYLRDNAYPLPAGAILISPWVGKYQIICRLQIFPDRHAFCVSDLTMSCESWESNSRYDVIPIPNPGDHLDPVSAYLGEHMERFLTHPYASPLFGDFGGLPPLLIQSGDAEVLRDEITLLAHKATLAGVNVRHELYEDAIHVFQLYPFLNASRRAFTSAREFVRKTLPDIQSRSPQMLDNKAEDVLEQEIDNENATVVRGTVSRRCRAWRKSVAEGVSELGEEPDLEFIVFDSVEYRRSRTGGRRRGLTRAIGTQENTNAVKTTSSQVPLGRTLRRRATMPTLTTLKRLSSAISYIMPDPMVASPSKLFITPTQHRHRHRPHVY